MPTNKKNHYWFALSVCFLFSQCQTEISGTYCADVKYRNNNTGKESVYRLTTEVYKNKLVQVNFPSEGHLDSEDFGIVEFSGDRAIAETSNGKTYTINLLKKGTGCLNDVSFATRCEGRTKEGRRCKNKTDNESGYCYLHLD